MNRSIKFGDRENPVATDEASLVAKPLKIRKHIPDIAGFKMPVFALENEQRRVLSENPIRAPENPELGALHVDLEQRDFSSK